MANTMRERVDTVENALKELAYAGRRTEMSVDRLSEEMREFKAEMSEFKAEMSDFKDEMAEFKDEMNEFKNEMNEFKNEMKDFKEENRLEYRRMNQQWGALANKWGTFTEDMVVPNFPHLLERYFGITEEQVEGLLVNPRKRHPTDRSRRKEFDLIAWTSEIVFWNETKASPKMRYLVEFIEDKESIFDFFPELAGRRLVKIASALSMTDEEIAYLTKNRCYAMALGEETMDLVNFEQVGELG
ncbi:MAG TPA: DUF3782 domain-containing protein [Spirochaetia bacterium]|nr:DUF3782 domain-containing protein [Spirochaetia bacterium]